MEHIIVIVDIEEDQRGQISEIMEQHHAIPLAAAE